MLLLKDVGRKIMPFRDDQVDLSIRKHSVEVPNTLAVRHQRHTNIDLTTELTPAL